MDTLVIVALIILVGLGAHLLVRAPQRVLNRELAGIIATEPDAVVIIESSAAQRRASLRFFSRIVGSIPTIGENETQLSVTLAPRSEEFNVAPVAIAINGLTQRSDADLRILSRIVGHLTTDPLVHPDVEPARIRTVTETAILIFVGPGDSEATRDVLTQYNPYVDPHLISM